MSLSAAQEWIAFLRSLKSLPWHHRSGVASRNAWRALPLLFHPWAEEKDYQDWWKGHGDAYTAALVVALMRSTKTARRLSAEVASAAFNAALEALEAAGKLGAPMYVVHGISCSLAALRASMPEAAKSSDFSLAASVESTVLLLNAYVAAEDSGKIGFVKLGKAGEFINAAISEDIDQSSHQPTTLIIQPLWPDAVMHTGWGARWQRVQAWSGNMPPETEWLSSWLAFIVDGKPLSDEMISWAKNWASRYEEQKQVSAKASEKAVAVEIAKEAKPAPPSLEIESESPRPRYKAQPKQSLYGESEAEVLTTTAGKCKDALQAFLVHKETGCPLNLSIEAPWGGGKSSVMRKLSESLEKDARIPTVWFNPWKHEAGKTLWAAFAVEYEHQMAANLPLLSRLWRRIGLNIKRLDQGEWTRFLFWLFAFFVVLFTWLCGWLPKTASAEVDKIITELAPWTAVLIFAWQAIKGAIQAVGSPLSLDVVKLFTQNQHEDSVDELHRFHEDFTRVMVAYKLSPGPLQRCWAGLRRTWSRLHAWLTCLHEQIDGFWLGLIRDLLCMILGFPLDSPTKEPESKKTDKQDPWRTDRVVVFIDDLDRCEAPKAADVLQSLHMMLDGARQQPKWQSGAATPPGVICVLGMDREKVAAAVAAKHEKLLPLLYCKDNTGKVNHSDAMRFGNEFLEKFIHLTLHLPQMLTTDLDEYLASMTRPGTRDDMVFNPAVLKGRVREANLNYTPGSPSLEEGLSNNVALGSSSTVEQSAQAAENQQRIEEVEILLDESDASRQWARWLAVALENNPRRLKQFINLFRLRLYLANLMSLLDVGTLQRGAKERYEHTKLSVSDIAKLVTLDLAFPEKMREIREGVYETDHKRFREMLTTEDKHHQRLIDYILECGTGAACDMKKAPLDHYFKQLAPKAESSSSAASTLPPKQNQWREVLSDDPPLS